MINLQSSCESGAEICFVFREEPGQAKVTDLRLEFVIKEDVAGLDISMNNPQVWVLMQVLQSSSDPDNDLESSLPV